jgi:hypothetical protein
MEQALLDGSAESLLTGVVFSEIVFAKQKH